MSFYHKIRFIWIGNIFLKEKNETMSYPIVKRSIYERSKLKTKFF